MQVSSKVTDLTTLTAAELADIGNYLSGIGAVALAIIVFYGIYSWREKSITEENKEL
jgi:hypothetical protein